MVVVVVVITAAVVPIAARTEVPKVAEATFTGTTNKSTPTDVSKEATEQLATITY
jgi:hypothetical protein